MKKFFGILFLIIGVFGIGIGIVALTDLATRSRSLEGQIQNEFSDNYSTKNDEQQVIGFAFIGGGLIFSILGISLIASKSKKLKTIIPTKNTIQTANIPMPALYNNLNTSVENTKMDEALNRMERLGKLKEQGLITEEEFQEQKKKLKLMKKYFIHNGQIELGPFEIEQLKTMQLRNETPVWFEGLQNWTTVGNVEDLKSILPINASPPKFVNPMKNNFSATPPNNNKLSNNSNQNDYPKSNLKRNLIIGGAILIGLVIFGFISSNSQSNSYGAEPPFNADIAENSGVSEAEIERQRINSAITKKNMNFRNNWQTYLTATTNQYQYREIGGIFNLAVIFTNNTDYVMDEVKVDINYIKENGSIYKTETVAFYNVLPGTQQSEQAPDSERGMSVELDVSQIYSKKMHFYYPSNSGNNEDPYFYKQ
jgi:hypothetical protein